MENNNENANTETVCDVAQNPLFNPDVVAERRMDTEGNSDKDWTSHLLADTIKNQAPITKTGRSQKTKNHVIYTLSDPITGLIMYVGYSSDLPRRIAAHLQQAKQKRSTKDQWIMSLIESNLLPVTKIVESVTPGNCDNAERRWILHLKENGHPLINGTKGGGIYKGKEQTKEHVCFYLSQGCSDFLNQEAKRTGQTVSWLISNTLAVAFGLRDWPKPPKGMKKAKEIAKK